MTRTCLCGDESRPNSWLCAECAKSAQKCESCGVPMIDHPGMYATCARLQKAIWALKVIQVWAEVAWEGTSEPSASKGFRDIAQKCTDILQEAAQCQP